MPTIKYYLRERLLPEGRLTSATQAQYDQEHVARLRLVRALLGPGGLSVATARQVLSHLDAPPEQTHELLGIAHAAVTPPAPEGADLSEVHELMRHWGWQVSDHGCDTQAALAAALDGIRAAGFRLPDGMLDRYAVAMYELAESEIANVPATSSMEAVHYVVLGTVLVEPLLLALRRVAEQEASTRRFGHTMTDRLSV